MLLIGLQKGRAYRNVLTRHTFSDLRQPTHPKMFRAHCHYKAGQQKDQSKQTGSRGAIMQRIEREIANLDQWQKKAVIESPAPFAKIFA